jgi:hypothetical protein
MGGIIRETLGQKVPTSTSVVPHAWQAYIMKEPVGAEETRELMVAIQVTFELDLERRRLGMYNSHTGKLPLALLWFETFVKYQLEVPVFPRSTWSPISIPSRSKCYQQLVLLQQVVAAQKLVLDILCLVIKDLEVGALGWMEIDSCPCVHYL